MYRLIFFAIVFLMGCQRRLTPYEVANQQGNYEVLSGNITQTIRLDSTKRYLLKGEVRVKAGASLIIPAGTIIFGDYNTKGTLIIEQGAKIVAQGTPNKPIVFTSVRPAGYRQPGDWGGIILLGRAPINQPIPAYVEGILNGAYGGNNPHDNSGILRYVRIEFAGKVVEQGNEVNALTFAGVGDSTIVEYIQASYCSDDAFEFFGGTVRARYLIAYHNEDDDFDTDFGYSGQIQFALSIRHPRIGNGDSNTFESDNDKQSSDNQPYTSAIFSNITAIGPMQDPNLYYKSGARIRRNSRLSVFNSVFIGFPKGFYINGANTSDAMLAGKSVVRNNFIVACEEPIVVDPAYQGRLDSLLLQYNQVISNVDSIQLMDTSQQMWLPKPTSPLLNAGDFSHPYLQNMQKVSFVGAFGSVDWTTPWANWDPQNTLYE